ncbi:AraC family transcriptional regulator [Arcobacter sp. FW59]|nr:AraC family transcriptional regulator [Arcobacter sp. FW59]
MSRNFALENISSFMSSSSKNRFNLALSDNFGLINCEKEFVNNDISIYKTEVETNKELSISSNSKVDGLFINIILDGNISYLDNNIYKTETFIKNDTYLKYLDYYNSTIIMDKNSYVKSLVISIKNSFLEKNLSSNKSLLEELQNHQKSTIIHKQDNQINIKLANELFHSPFYSDLHNIYIQSKVLELIYNQFSSLLDDKNKFLLFEDKIKLSRDDIEALYKAKDIILTSQEFPDLVTLSKKVALNQFKLKYGFRQLFNTSPGNMILEQKMIYAKQLLETSEFSISEISNFVGYKYQSNFTNAFIKFFGVLPKDIMVQRKYYY